MLNYQDTLDYLFTRLPMFSRIGSAAYKADLNNTIALCDYIGNPQQKFKSIHIAGTNGKGSVSHMLAAILQSAGYKTGLYTSPHLRDFRERIKINGQMISEDAVVQFTHKMQPVIEEMEPSFFEITVAMAFEYFASQKVAVAVIETGLGGRLDSTNVITPELSVITNIGYDHVNLLGDTLPKIASEKAGIIKQMVPVVIGETLPETKQVFVEKAVAEHSPIFFAEEQWHTLEWKQEPGFLSAVVSEKGYNEATTYQLGLTGLYQLKNLLTVLSSLRQLKVRGWNICEADIQNGIKNVQSLTGLEGRWQVVKKQPFTVLDVGHNEDGVRQIVAQLAHCNYKQLHIVIGMVKDKDVNSVLGLLPGHATYYFTQSQIPRALPAEALAKLANDQGLMGDVFDTVNDALNVAMRKAHVDDMVLVCGSVFLIGEIDSAIFTN